MAKRIHFLSTDLPLTFDERQQLVEEVLQRLREMGHDDDVILLNCMKYQGTVE